MESRLDAVIDKAIGENLIVGTVVMVMKDGKPAYQRIAGFADREAGRKMTEDTIFRLASVTKPLVAATTLAMIERGILGFDRNITEWLPHFRPRLLDGYTPEITIRHLLTHTAGFGYPTAAPDDPYVDAGISGGLEDQGMSMEENLKRIAEVPLFFAPGTGWRYGVSLDILGEIVGRAHGGTLGDAVAHYVTGPLGMVDTAFSVTDRARLAAAYADSDHGAVLMDDPHQLKTGPGAGMVFSPSRIFRPEAFQSGGAGMAGTAGDFMRFLETIRTGGGPILKADTVEAALANQVGEMRDADEPGAGFGYLSGIVVDPERTGIPYSVGTARWGGVYGHNWFMDRKAGISAFDFTNTAVEGCIGAFPKDITRAVYG
ncbi:MAG: beta-lactamase family protein [Bauldia sp.]|nr:beta-lactamase family protein [Bauldia sp.]